MNQKKVGGSLKSTQTYVESPRPPPLPENIRSPLGLSGLSHRMPVRVCQCHLLARPCRLNVDIPWICRYFLFAGYLTYYEWTIGTWLFNSKNTWTSQSWMQNILQFYCQTVGVWVSQFSWFCQEINPGTTVYLALPTVLVSRNSWIILPGYSRPGQLA